MSKPDGTALRLTEPQVADLRLRAEWWWDEAARCREIGADGLQRFAIAQATSIMEEASPR